MCSAKDAQPQQERTETMLRRPVHTDGGIAGLLLRLTRVVVILPHGAQKALGWFGGRGFVQTLASFMRSGIPMLLALLVIGTDKFISIYVLHCASKNRRYPLWPVYGLPMCSLVRRSFWISRA